jgi:radical SAM protein with 4Fe4S-binding SPASM domain
MSCWPGFELETKGVHANSEVGIYGQPIREVTVCPYIFYSFSINSNGTASACFLDWERKLIIGNARTESVKQIWRGAQLLAHQRMMLKGERKGHPVCGNCDQLKRGWPDDIDAWKEKLLKKLDEVER